jgi:hypothetical protein
MESKGVYQLLRNFDRDCNIRLKIQVIKKATTTLENDSFQKEQEEITNVVENVTSCVTRVDLFMKEMFLGAEKNRQSKENAFVNTSIEAVLHRAKEWLDSKDGKNYIKRQIPIETEVFKMELQRTKATTTTSSIMKPKGMKKLILDRIEEKYCTQQQEEARHAAIKTFRIQNPIYDPLHVTQKEWSKLKQNLTQVKTID